MFYAKSTNGFYSEAMHGEAMPTDAVEISAETYVALLTAQAGGQVITADADGNPVSVAPQTLMTLAEIQAFQVAELTTAYQAAITGNVIFTTAAGTSAPFPQSSQAKGYLSQCITAGDKSWTLNLWLDASNVPVTPFTYADLQGLAAAFESAEIPAYQELLTLIGQVHAATTVEAVEAITWAWNP